MARPAGRDRDHGRDLRGEIPPTALIRAIASGTSSSLLLSYTPPSDTTLPVSISPLGNAIDGPAGLMTIPL